jgi:SH3-like domain-containing protein
MTGLKDIGMKLHASFAKLVVATGIALVSIETLAAEFKNIGPAPVIMYDAPSGRGEKLFVAPRGMPVEVVINYGAWSKVRDFAGDLSWVETKQLVDRKNILVKNLNAKIYSSANENSSVVFSADKGVLLEFIDATTPGWVRVKHSDGATGYIKLADVWGA